jgi:CelD/BcsL family acetyltransferase involved in cellulose biosynthesis
MSELHLKILSGPTALRQLRTQWDELAERLDGGYFQTWEWVTAWYEVLEPSAELAIVVVQDESGKLHGVLPLARITRRFHRLLPVRSPYLGLAGSGGGAGDHLAPLSSSGEVFEMLVAGLLRASDGKCVFLESLAAGPGGHLQKALGAKVVGLIRCPAIDLRSLDSPESGWPKKLRENIRRRDRQLADLGVRGQWIPAGQRLVKALDQLQELHLSRWRSRGQGGLFDETRLTFLQRLCELASPPQGPWLYTLERGGEPIGALLGFQHGSTFASYKTGWDPAYTRQGVGIALSAEAIRRAHRESLATFDFLRGAEPHKYSFGAVDRVDVSLLAWRGPRGLLLLGRETISARRASEESGRRAPGRSSAPASKSSDLESPPGGWVSKPIRMGGRKTRAGRLGLPPQVELWPYQPPQARKIAP